MSIQQHQSTALNVNQRSGKISWPRVIAKLFKLRIVSLLLFAALGGAFIAEGGIPSLSATLLTIVAGGLGAAGASGLNQYIERQKDAHMVRTSGRPLVDGTIKNAEIVLFVSLAMILVPVFLLWFSNAPMAFFILAGAIIYVLVYTVWLKPRTILNIVIGGAAGSCAVLTGSAAVGNWSDPGAVALSILVFLWTPTHFWALAIMVREDYVNVDIPMLPAVTSPRDSAIWGFFHALAVVIVAIAMASVPALGWTYFIPTALMSILLLYKSAQLIRIPEKPIAKSLFLTSNSYLAVVILFACLATVTGF